jgi:tight adherence protein B
VTALIAVCLVAGAVTIVWPARRRLVVRAPRDRAALRLVIRTWAGQNPRRTVLASIAAVAAVGLLVGGPVAAVVGAVYAALGGRALLRRANSRRAAAERSAALDDLAALAADLRAGLVVAAPVGRPSGSVLGGAEGAGWAPRTAGRMGWTQRGADRTGSVSRIADRTGSVWRLAERTGAPAADLVERIEADARTADRAAASASAQAAGAQATAMLLAGLPIGGIGLGVAIGADPVRVLFHTPLGAGCAIAAVLLQSAGLLWADRLASGVAR